MKRIIAAILCVATLLGLSCHAFAAEGERFECEEAMAQVLKNLGLFQGRAEGDFALGDKATREEAVTMLIRLLGKEEEAKNGTWEHPFGDVSEWAQCYVGYAYQNGLTNGISPTEFGGKSDVTAEMYLTYVLRALRVDGGSYDWRNPYAAAYLSGAFPAGVDIHDFRRADMVAISYAALVTNKTKDDLISYDEWVALCENAQSLEEMLTNAERSLTGIGEFLVNENVISIDAVRAGYRPELLSAYENANRLSDEALGRGGGTFALYPEFADGSTGFGVGFFVDDKGTAVTRFQCIAGAVRAKAAVYGQRKDPEILGVYAYNVQEDWVLLKVDMEGNDYYPVNVSDTPQNADHVFATYPDGRGGATISGGVISDNGKQVNGAPRYENNARTDNGQTSSGGGGALLNERGEAIGITLNRINADQDVWQRGDAVPLRCVELEAKNGSIRTLAEVTEEVGVYTTTLVRMQQWAERTTNEALQAGVYGYRQYYENYDIFLLPHGLGGAERDNFTGIICYYTDTGPEIQSVTQYLDSSVIELVYTIYSDISDYPLIAATLSIDTKEIPVENNLFCLPSDAEITIGFDDSCFDEITEQMEEVILQNMTIFLNIHLGNCIALLDGIIGGYDLTDIGYTFDGLTLGD